MQRSYKYAHTARANLPAPEENSHRPARAAGIIRPTTARPAHDPHCRDRRRPAHQQPVGRVDAQRRAASSSTSGSPATRPKPRWPASTTTRWCWTSNWAASAMRAWPSSTPSTSCQGTPVLVVSAMPAAIYRSIMKALDAWDYLQKTTFLKTDFIETFSTSCATQRRPRSAPLLPRGRRPGAGPAVATHPTRRGERINRP